MLIWDGWGAVPSSLCVWYAWLGQTLWHLLDWQLDSCRPIRFFDFPTFILATISCMPDICGSSWDVRFYYNYSSLVFLLWILEIPHTDGSYCTLRTFARLNSLGIMPEILAVDTLGLFHWRKFLPSGEENTSSWIPHWALEWARIWWQIVSIVISTGVLDFHYV